MDISINGPPNSKIIFVDCETAQRVGFFEKGCRKKDWLGHPIHSQLQMVSCSDGRDSFVFRDWDHTAQLLNEKKPVFHNASFDILSLVANGVLKDAYSLPAFEDTMMMARLLDHRKNAGLKPLARHLLGENPVEYSEALAAGEPEFEAYAKRDAEYTARLYPILRKELEERGLVRLYEEVEIPFLRVDIECQLNGILIDREVLLALKVGLAEDVRILEEVLDAV